MRWYALPFIMVGTVVMPGRDYPATIHVPADQPSIQAGIDAAADGDTILIADGTYTGEGNRDIDFRGKAAVLQGNTIYDNYASSPHDDTGGGGGVLIWLCSPTISNNAIYNNSDGGDDTNYGGGIYSQADSTAIASAAALKEAFDEPYSFTWGVMGDLHR